MKAYLVIGEVKRLADAATCLRDRLLIWIIFWLGCRISEALAIEVRHIDFQSGTVTIEHLKSRIRLLCQYCGNSLSRGHTFCPKCGRKVKEAGREERQHRRMRVLPLDPEILKLLREYIERGGPVNKEGKLFIFGINRHRAWQIVKECAERAGLEKLYNPDSGKWHNVSPHRLRDAFSVMAIKKDDSTDGVRMLQQQLGHASITTTMRYRKVSGHELKEWYQRLRGRKGD